ncbi:MAG TPA: LptA/OstA family protein, partial [Verrucomicrobiota bacterium]|nr:LptA/OstA family protein [Verrucomicrobiota bacterium]
TLRRGTSRPPSKVRFMESLRLAVLAIALACLGGSFRCQAQSGAEKAAPFTVPVYDRDDPNRMVALLSGSIAEFDLSGRQPLETVRVEYYDGKGGTNLVFVGTNCVYDARRRTAESPGTLRVMSGDGRLDLEGQGFTWWQTNNDLVISNRVETRVRRPETVGGVADPLGGQDLRVSSDRFRFNYRSNLIVYSGHVRVEDPRVRMSSGWLTIVPSARGGIDRMVAEEDVKIVDRSTGGETTARTAVYQVDGQRETVELSGEPRYREGVREGTADRFILDRRRDVLEAVGNARIVFPLGAGGTPGLLAIPGPGPRPSEGATNRLIELSANLITILLPATNGPVRGVVAETNVVLLDPEQRSRATARRARYQEGIGLELTGDPVWSSGGQSLEGGAMRYDLAGQVFRVSDGVMVRLPVTALTGPVRGLEGVMPGGGLGLATNQVVEIRSLELEYREPWLQFEGGTRADYLDGRTKLGELQCAALGVLYSNSVREVRASGGVRLEQLPAVRKGGGTTAKLVQCDAMTAGFDAEGQLERFKAEGGVDARQTDIREGRRDPVVKRLQCDALDARFWGRSNLVELATAERNVVVSQDDRVVQAERAVFTGTNDLLSLFGRPTVILPEGRITEAETITWNRATGLYRIAGRFKSQWKALPGVTNLINLPSIIP